MGDAFGFDPSLILNAQTAAGRGFDSGLGTANSLAQLAQAGLQRQAAQAELQQKLWEQGRARNLASLVSQHAGDFSNPYAQSLAGAGFGQEAFEAQQRALQQQMAQAEFGQKVMGISKGIVTSQLMGADAPAKIKAIGQRLPDILKGYYTPPADNAPDQEWLDWRKGFLAGQVDPAKAKELETAATAAQKDRFKTTETGIPGTLYQTDTATGKGKPVSAMGATGAPYLPTGDALDSLVKMYKAGQNIDGALGPDPGGLKHAAVARAAGAVNVPANAAVLGADKASLEQLQPKADLINTNILTLDKNMGIAEEALAKLKSSNSPGLNKAIRWGQEHASGDPALTAYVNALNTVRSELGKINSGSTGQGGTPISVLEEMEKGLPNDATPAQYAAAMKVYRQDSVNRQAAMREQLDAVKGRLYGKKAGAEKRTAKGRAVPAGITHTRTDPATGETRGWNGKAWVQLGSDD